MRLLRRIRGIVGTALTWAAGWGILGAVVSALSIVASGPWDGPPVAKMVFLGALFLATYGFIAGLVFSLVVLAAERRRTLHQLTLPRVTAWGGLGGVLMAAVPVAATGPSVLTGVFLLMSGLLGAGSAAASLAVARRGLPAAPAIRRVEGSPDH
jgi:hypothetical protein